MNGRLWLRVFWGILPWPLAAGPLTAAEADRPNILWITCEDVSPDLGCYGNQYAITPNLDRLAGEGVRYTNAFSVCGVCAVGRSCLITGVYPVSLRSHHMRCRTVLPEQVKCFSELLRKAGYYTTNNVKTDYNFDVPREAWDESSNTGGGVDLMPTLIDGVRHPSEWIRISGASRRTLPVSRFPGNVRSGGRPGGSVLRFRPGPSANSLRRRGRSPRRG